jgi:hypothetical protein
MPPSFVSTNRGKSLPMFFENIGAKVLHAMLFTGANDGHRPCPLEQPTNKQHPANHGLVTCYPSYPLHVTRVTHPSPSGLIYRPDV